MTDLNELRSLARAAFNARNGIGPEAADWNSRAHANEAFHRAFEDPMTVLALIERAKSADSYRRAANVFEHDFGVMRERLKDLQERYDLDVEPSAVALRDHAEQAANEMARERDEARAKLSELRALFRCERCGAPAACVDGPPDPYDCVTLCADCCVDHHDECGPLCHCPGLRDALKDAESQETCRSLVEGVTEAQERDEAIDQLHRARRDRSALLAFIRDRQRAAVAGGDDAAAEIMLGFLRQFDEGP